MNLIESLLMDMMLRPFRAAFLLLLGGFACGVLTIIAIHFIWLNTVFHDRMEQEMRKEQQQMNKKLVYQVYQQRSCVAKWRMTKDCVEWAQ